MIEILHSDALIYFFMTALDLGGDFRLSRGFAILCGSPKSIFVFLNLKVGLIMTYQILGQRDFGFDF